MKCENCGEDHGGSYGSGRFCGVKCSRGFSTKHKRAEINKAVSAKMEGRTLTQEHKDNIEKANNFNRKEKTTRHCLECEVELVCRPSDKRKFCSSVCWAKHTERNKEPFLLYRQRCNFEFDPSDFPDKFDLVLIETHGRYSPSNKGNNINGVSMDHMLSVRSGFDLGIAPEIIKHPANCQLLLHRDNQKKNTKNSLTIDELLQRIEVWFYSTTASASV